MEKGAVVLDLAFALFVTAMMLHFCIAAVSMAQQRTSSFVEQKVLMDKTAAYADFLVKEGLAKRSGSSVLEHEISSDWMRNKSALEYRAEEFGLKNAKIGVQEGVRSDGLQITGRLCLQRLSLMEGKTVRVWVCSD